VSFTFFDVVGDLGFELSWDLVNDAAGGFGDFGDDWRQVPVEGSLLEETHYLVHGEVLECGFAVVGVFGVFYFVDIFGVFGEGPTFLLCLDEGQTSNQINLVLVEE